MIHTPSAASATRILASLLEARTGQQTAPSRYWRIQTALAPLLKRRSLPDLEALVVEITRPGQEALVQEALELMLNNESFFFRDAGMFNALRQDGLALLRERRAASRRLRIWSAGCSTGQEAYSLAMVFDADAAQWQGWTIEIIGTDISQTVLAKARAGHYCQFEIQRGLPIDLMLRYFDQGETGWTLSRAIRDRVSFRADNLVKPTLDLGVFDLILCRNVLMYFGPESRDAAYDRLRRSIAPDGLLMLGAAETVLGHTALFSANSSVRGLYAPVADALAKPAMRRTAG